MSGQGWLSVCIRQGWAGWGWAAPGMGKGFQMAVMVSSSGTSTACAISTRCITCSVRDVSFGAGDLGHYPAPLGTGSSHRDSLQRPVRSLVLYQAEMQELREFLKLVLGSAIFFFLISPLGREGKSLAGSSKPAYVTSIQSYHRSNKAIKQAWLASFFCCLWLFLGEAEGFPCSGSPQPGFTAAGSCSWPTPPAWCRGQERAVLLLAGDLRGGRGAQGVGACHVRGAEGWGLVLAGMDCL